MARQASSCIHVQQTAATLLMSVPIPSDEGAQMLPTSAAAQNCPSDCLMFAGLCPLVHIRLPSLVDQPSPGLFAISQQAEHGRLRPVLQELQPVVEPISSSSRLQTRQALAAELLLEDGLLLSATASPGEQHQRRKQFLGVG